jgi:sugar-specific transcriptional regulator TrmB
MMELGILSAVSIIAKKAGINRTTTYDILHQLEEKGVVISQAKKNNRYYEALPPEKIINYLNRQQDKYAKLSVEALNLLPELQSHYRVTGRPRVYFYEGDEGLMRVYEETLTSSGEILGYAAEQEGIEWYLDSYLQRTSLI